MKLSELNCKTLAEYINIGEDDPLLPGMMEAAIGYAENYTGHTREELENVQEMWIAIAALVSDMYDNRSMNVKEEGVNKTATTILDMHSCNLI